MTEQEQVTNVQFISQFSFQQKVGTYRKTKLEDNCWMKLYMSGNPGAAMLSFVDSEDKNINVPDEFILTDISRCHIPTKIDPISLKLFALVISHNYSFTYKDKSGKLILQWAMMGEFEWE